MATQPKNKALHISLWVAQILLAAAFGMAGFMKTTAPLDQLYEMGMKFVQQSSPEMVRFIGIVELLGALGLLLPAALRILPFFTPLAALGVAAIMVLAIFEHLAHNESIIPNIILLLMALFIAWGRFIQEPISSKK